MNLELQSKSKTLQELQKTTEETLARKEQEIGLLNQRGSSYQQQINDLADTQVKVRNVADTSTAEVNVSLTIISSNVCTVFENKNSSVYLTTSHEIWNWSHTVRAREMETTFLETSGWFFRLVHLIRDTALINNKLTT